MLPEFSLAQLDQKLKRKGYRGLRIHHRNLISYLYTHTTKYPGKVCRVPKAANNHKIIYIKAINYLEELEIITVDRVASDYFTWTIAFTPEMIQSEDPSNG